MQLSSALRTRLALQVHAQQCEPRTDVLEKPSVSHLQEIRVCQRETETW